MLDILATKLRQSGLLWLLSGLSIAAAMPACAHDADRALRLSRFVRPQTVPFPADNPYSPEKAELGRLLFFDPMLSASGTISCASCHHPRLAWGDGLPAPSAKPVHRCRCGRPPCSALRG